jgi:hypothetical protein
VCLVWPVQLSDKWCFGRHPEGLEQQFEIAVEPPEGARSNSGPPTTKVDGPLAPVKAGDAT